MMLLDFMPLYVTAGYSFASDWHHHHDGMEFTEEVMRNPLARVEQEYRAQRYLRERYPELFPGGPDSVQWHANLGIGVATIPLVWGCRVRYLPHMNPSALPLLGPGDDPMDLGMSERQVLDNMNWLFEEIDTLVDAGFEKNKIGLPDLQGPLNLSMKLLGDSRVLKLFASPKKADLLRHVLDAAAEVYITVTRELRKATNRPTRSNFSISGCTYFYTSPRHWTEFVLPVVRRLEVLGDRIRLHHCGEANTDKVEAYAQYPFHEVEFGFGSDLKRARELFVHPVAGPVQMSCRVSPYRMLNQPAGQIYRDVEWILEQVRGGPASVNVVGVPLGAPDENLLAMRAAVDDYNAMKERELEEEES
ncbi:MAG: hypothetical protein ACTSU5_16750 [Promethearchaeota archaeon]